MIKKKDDSKEYKKYSLIQFPWDSKEEKTLEETMVETTLVEWYNAIHRNESKEEIDFINSIEVSSCPYCNSNLFVKNGFTIDGIQKYKCKVCSRQFNVLSGTIFDSKKIPISEWIEFLLHLFEYHSIKTSATDNRNADTTGTYWLRKVFAILEGIQDDVVLEGTIYLDEMLLPVIKSKTITKDNKKLRGVSRNKISVACAVDEKGKSILIVGSSCKPSDKSTFNAYGKHIKEGSKIVHDGEKSHNYLIEQLGLESEVHTSKQTKGLKDSENPLDPINDLHCYAKLFFRNHGSYNRDNLQDWLNPYW